uniref:Uncharacterized protein n=1 Tax=Arundo donax TaxID=35708 RepID=A0A0A9H8F3_ARUDO
MSLAHIPKKMSLEHNSTMRVQIS